MSVRYSSRFPEIELKLQAKMDDLAKDVADLVAEQAAIRVPVDTGDLKDAIHVERREARSYDVLAGNDDVFYGRFVEFGGARSAPHPFMLPAAEEARTKIPGMAKDALGSL